MQSTQHSVDEFIDKIADDAQKQDAKSLIKLMQKTTGEKPKMWGSSIIGFGTLHYKYASGREGDTVTVGFSPRKNALVLYGVAFHELNQDRVKKLGKYKTGKGCLYISHLSDIDMVVLEEMIKVAYEHRSTSPIWNPERSSR